MRLLFLLVEAISASSRGLGRGVRSLSNTFWLNGKLNWSLNDLTTGCLLWRSDDVELYIVRFARDELHGAEGKLQVGTVLVLVQRYDDTSFVLSLNHMGAMCEHVPMLVE